MLRPIDIGSQSNPGRFPHAGATRLINMRAEEAGKEGKVQFPVYAVSGLTAFSTLTGGAGVRRMLAADADLYTVAGRVVFRTDLGGTSTVLGGIPSDGVVTMARNGRRTGAQTGIVCDGLFYIIASNVLTQVNDADLASPNSICFLGGYFFFTCNQGRWQWSELNAGDDIDGLSFGTANVSPDDLVCGKARGRDLLLFGRQSTEVWTLNDGSGDAPVSFRSAMSIGALAAGAVVDIQDTILWPATTEAGAFGGVRILDGDVPREIGNEAVNRAFSRETSPSAITGTAWTEDGRTFVAWSGTDWTWVYDVKTGLWHERATNGDRWRASYAVQFGSYVIAGDAEEGLLYRLAHDIYTDGADELVCTVQTPPVHAYPNKVEVSALYLDTLPGVGLASGAVQDTAPSVGMQWSHDGETWSTELRRDLGGQGQTTTRVGWRRLGTQAQTGRTYRFSSSAAVARGILGATIDFETVDA